MIVLRGCAFLAMLAPGMIALQLATGYQPGYLFLFGALPIAAPLAVILGSATLHGGWKRGRLPVEGRSTFETLAAWLTVFFPIHGGSAFLLWWHGPRAGDLGEWLLLVAFVPVVLTALPILLAPSEEHPIRGESWRDHA